MWMHIILHWRYKKELMKSFLSLFITNKHSIFVELFVVVLEDMKSASYLLVMSRLVAYTFMSHRPVVFLFFLFLFLFFNVVSLDWWS